MKKLFALITLFLFTIPTHAASDAKSKALLDRMTKVTGSYSDLWKLKDIQYIYIYRSPNGKEDTSLERYIFDGELSWAKYTKREVHVHSNVKGEVIQGYDGKKTWLTIDGKNETDPQKLKIADFLRKTNFYWLAMMQKLQDPGINATHQGTENVDGVSYDKVKITFGENVGDAQDTYILYFNPKSNLVDQFLFTVMDFGMKDPLLMRVKYKDVHGVKLPTYRKYIESNWDGDIRGKGWTEEISKNIAVNNGFKKTSFTVGGDW